MKKRLLIALVGLIILVLAFQLYNFFFFNRGIKLSDSIPDIDSTREAIVLTAFFGRDSDLPLQSIGLYRKAPGKDGMPLVFSQEMDPSTLDNTDFQVTTQNGTKFNVEHVTLKPASEEFELRTVLMIGEFGDHPENPPVAVEIVGDLMSRSGQNYKGQIVEVIPLPEGPVISYAEHFVIDDDYPYVKRGRGCDCPKETTEMVVRAVWSGGVRALGGGELGENELDAFEITIVQGTDTIKTKPFKLADLKDNDNNLDLCLKENGVPLFVVVKANTAIDPNDDPNPLTRREITNRW